MQIGFEVNGKSVTVEAAPTDRLLDVLRLALGLTGTKEGCGEGECGACCVHMNGLPVNSCLVPAFQAEGCDVRTVEGVDLGALAPLLASGATQCGACTPGVVMAAMWIRENSEALALQSVRELMAGNLCRCTGYDGIVKGVEALVAARGGGAC